MSENAKERLERLEAEGLVSDGKWNKRVLRHPCGSLAIHSVYYSKDGNVLGYSEEGANAVDPEEGLQGLIESVEAGYEQAKDALAKPVLEWHELPHGLN